MLFVRSKQAVSPKSGTGGEVENDAHCEFTFFRFRAGNSTSPPVSRVDKRLFWQSPTLILSRGYCQLICKDVNGLITNDKFRMIQTARLQFSWWRLPRNARQVSSEDVQSPVEEIVRGYLPKPETYEKTTMERSAHIRRTT